MQASGVVGSCSARSSTSTIGSLPAALTKTALSQGVSGYPGSQPQRLCVQHCMWLPFFAGSRMVGSSRLRNGRRGRNLLSAARLVACSHFRRVDGDSSLALHLHVSNNGRGDERRDRRWTLRLQVQNLKSSELSVKGSTQLFLNLIVRAMSAILASGAITSPILFRSSEENEAS
jgi:hypothetical protein